MNLTRKVLVLCAVLLVLAAAVYFAMRPDPAPGSVNGVRILAAAQQYTRLFASQNLVVPETVALEDLLARGLLRKEDVTGLKGAEVTVWLRGDPRNPATVLMRARFKDGQDLLLMMDGSVRQVPSAK